MIYAAHVIDPRCKASMIKDMMPDTADWVLDNVKKYMKSEWPDLAKSDTPSLVPSSESSTSNTRPNGISVAQWKAIQNKKAKEAALGEAQLTSELERWLQSEPLEWSDSVNNHPDFLRTWWKEHAAQWPRLAKAALDLLAVSASEVDVERLFSGCTDEYGIRRHALKADTVRVLTLLRSQYTSEDDRDDKLIESAMQLDIVEHCNSIIWRPDLTNAGYQKVSS